jgi:GT2 family glycosyltransferase
MPDISIIILSFNTKDLTLQCIKSVLDSEPKSRYEIVIVDNGSTDGSASEFTAIKDKNIKVVLNNENTGFAKGNNVGIKIARGNYILLLNSDTKVKKSAIDKLLSFASKTQNAGVIGARLLNSDGSLQDSCFNFPTIGRAIKQFWLKQGRPLDKFLPPGDKPQTVDAVVGAAFLITPEAKKKVGYLDERYFMFYEDLDYCRKTWKAGLKVYYLPESLVVHSHGASGKKLAGNEDQWRRLIPSSIIYHGLIKHYLINFIIWSAHIWQKLFS